jgi:hypothetical protein
MSLTDAQIALFLETVKNIELHLATLASAAQEQNRLAAQTAARPVLQK